MKQYIEIEMLQNFPQGELDLILHLKTKYALCSADAVDVSTGKVSSVNHTLFSGLEWEGVTGCIIDAICELLKEQQ